MVWWVLDGAQYLLSLVATFVVLHRVTVNLLMNTFKLFGVHLVHPHAAASDTLRLLCVWGTNCLLFSTSDSFSTPYVKVLYFHVRAFGALWLTSAITGWMWRHWDMPRSYMGHHFTHDQRMEVLRIFVTLEVVALVVMMWPWMLAGLAQVLEGWVNILRVVSKSIVGVMSK